jgi:hypothetical protein
MDPLPALRRCVKPTPTVAFLWWPEVRAAIADLMAGVCEVFGFRKETAFRSLQLFERIAALHQCKRMNQELIFLDAAVAFMIGHKFEESEFVAIPDIAKHLRVGEEELRTAEKLVLAELGWAVYSPTCHQFADVMVEPGPLRQKVITLLDKFSLRALLPAEQMAEAAVQVAKGERGAHTAVLEELAMPATESRKRARSHPAAPSVPKQ